jgi:hypothetical protein
MTHPPAAGGGNGRVRGMVALSPYGEAGPQATRSRPPGQAA